MEKETVTFNDMPSVVTEIRDDVKGIKEQLQILLKKMESSHTDSPERVSMSVEDLAKYLCMPAKTVYDKLKKGDIPAYKPGKLDSCEPIHKRKFGAMKHGSRYQSCLMVAT